MIRSGRFAAAMRSTAAAARRIGGRARSRHRPGVGRDLPDSQTDVPGKLDVDRTRLATGGDLDGAAHHPGNVLRQLDRRGPLRDRGEHGDVVGLLKRAFAIRLARRAHPEHKHRRTARVRLEDTGHEFGDPRSGAPEAGRDLIGHAGIGHRHEGARGLEADPDRPRPAIRLDRDERVIQVPGSPGRPKTYGTPSAFMARTTASHPVTVGIGIPPAPSVFPDADPQKFGKFGKFSARLASPSTPAAGRTNGASGSNGVVDSISPPRRISRHSPAASRQSSPLPMKASA